jgi:outer membrane protein W
VAKRHRIGLGIGYWDTGEPQGPPSECSASIETNVQDLQGTLFYGYWTQEKLAATVAMRGLVVEAQSSVDFANVCESSVVVASILFGVRYYPFATPQSPLRPYITGSAGPYIGTESTTGVDFGVTEQTKTQGSFGGMGGAGVDILIGRYFMADINIGYNVMKDFSEPIGGEINYNGFEFGIGFSVLIGKGI